MNNLELIAENIKNKNLDKAMKFMNNQKKN